MTTMASPATTTKPSPAPKAEDTKPSPSTATTTPAPTEKKALTKDEGRALFAAYQTADDAVTAAETALEVAKAARSHTVGAIVDGYGSAGPFRYKGRQLTARKMKGGTGYTFAEKSEQEPLEIG